MLGALACSAVVALSMALRNFYLAQSIVSMVGFCILMVVGLTNLFAFVSSAIAWSTGTKNSSTVWLTAAVAGQALIVCLAGYVILMDLRSPAVSYFKTSLLALIFVCAAMYLVLRLGRHSMIPSPKSATALALAVPLFGLGQYWLDTEYLPRSLRPLVDITTTLTPVGHSGRIIHLAAEVTLTSRAKVPVDVAGSLMRVTAYRDSTGRQWAGPEDVAGGIDLSGYTRGSEFRMNPRLPADAMLLYVDDFMPAGSFLGAGETATVQHVVDVDSSYMDMIRLSADAAFVTNRAVEDTRTCGVDPQSVSVLSAPEIADKTLVHTADWTGAHMLCLDTVIKPRNVVDELVSDQPAFRVMVTINEPFDQQIEYPQLQISATTVPKLAHFEVDAETTSRVEAANRLAIATGVAEYSPSDRDVDVDVDGEPKQAPPAR